MKKSRVGLLVLVLSFVLVLAACSSSDTAPSDQGSQNDSVEYEGSALDAAYEGKFKGTKVHILGPFGSPDEELFNESLASFREATGIDVRYEFSDQIATTLQVRIDGGNAPDIVGFPQPGALADFVKQGHIIDVKTFLDEEYLVGQYSKDWVDMLHMENGKGEEIVAGVWQRANGKSFVWYPVQEFEDNGYQVPETWEELEALMDQMVEDGYAPWSIGFESGQATGWPGTDWIEDIMLRTTSLENYDKWTTGELPFTSPEVERSFEIMADIFFNEKYVHGGRQGIVNTGFGEAPNELFTNPPKALLMKQGNFITSFFPDGLTEEDFDFFVLPAIDEEYGAPILVGGDIMSMVNDRPEVRAVMEYLTKGESLKTWIQAGGAISPHTDSDLNWYSSEVERQVAQFILEADAVRFDGSDLMPATVGTGTFWTGITEYIAGQIGLEEALKEIQSGFDR